MESGIFDFSRYATYVGSYCIDTIEMKSSDMQASVFQALGGLKPTVFGLRMGSGRLKFALGEWSNRYLLFFKMGFWKWINLRIPSKNWGSIQENQKTGLFQFLNIWDHISQRSEIGIRSIKN